MIKKIICICIVFFAVFYAYSQKSATDIVATSESIDTTVSELKNIVQNGKSNNEKYDAALLLAQIQEQFGEYTEASLYYTTASSLIGTQSAKGQDLLLGAVRCALLIGDVSRADFLLSTALTSITDASAKARANLYAVWSWIIKSETTDELQGPIAVLKSYLSLESMESVHPALLLTLYHLTDENSWSEQLQKEYPNSPESSIVKGNAQLLPTPFWFLSTIKE